MFECVVVIADLLASLLACNTHYADWYLVVVLEDCCSSQQFLRSRQLTMLLSNVLIYLIPESSSVVGEHCVICTVWSVLHAWRLIRKFCLVSLFCLADQPPFVVIHASLHTMYM